MSKNGIQSDQTLTEQDRQVTNTAGSVTDPILEARDVRVSFDMARGESRVLNDVSIDVERNEVLGVVGESGSGKSMFASALLNAVVDPGRLSGEVHYHPQSGESINLANATPEELKRYRWKEISMVFQGAMSSFNPVQKICAHFEETLRAHQYDVQSGMEHARQLLSDLYLDPERVMESYPHELSGGMQQRALLALSLVLEPEVIVMDEPTAALDLLMQRSILSLISDLQETYDLTVAFITHDLPLVAGLADRLGVLYAFEFVEVGPTREVIKNPAHPYTRELLNSVPNLDTPLDEMTTIAGSSPDPVNLPSGCSYHPRCPFADEECRAEHPEFVQVENDHDAACFHIDEARDEIHLAYDEDQSGTRERVYGMQSEQPVISLQDLSVHFEENQGLSNLFDTPGIVKAVDGVNLDIYENDVVALVGESGCGKTTLGKTAIGVQRPTGGSVKYRDDDIWEVRDGNRDDVSWNEIRKSLQIIHQDPGESLNPNRTVMKILETPLKQAQSELSYKDRHARIYGMLEYVGLTPPEDYAERYPHQLSGGEKQRVALVRALFMNPDMILADEAVSALDVSLRVEMMDLMLELQDLFNTSYLFISHNLSNARYLAGTVGGRIGVMYLGKIVEIGPAEEMIQNSQHPYTKILKWSTTNIDPDQEPAEEPPIREIDIPDPIDPPSGCPFHTRCPKAREVCTEEVPDIDESADHGVACFRTDETHEYWNSDPLEDIEPDQEVFNDD
ncbi:Dipeptide ABC transporter ATP-binding domain containing protein [Halorhabdus tiamatea SARL4B]|uniref:Dipeptide ABC transporter ATP-binding domain containing protein n=1 Tax=Halorhabdus tiamatea SARL4B TaxID=1033806 RepID=F7PQK5_9EURY|nr:ABC transporter ATP-binding protein [Halorhabdus tiamatea]ERJ05324.1 Dipeptide ABC transporter ATP-binding domain containing protein [Halorhabdus tiamatea SARL4B]CCQ33190.1 peptide ABC transporter ATPase [Halorhabdus tiamatea SARL4B]